MIKQVHKDRMNTLINFLEKNNNGEKIILKRKEIADIVGVSEGDSLKMIFKILNEYPEIYSDRISYEKVGKENHFRVISDNITNKDTIWEIDNVLELGKNRFLTKLSAAKINELWNEGIITYNPNIQRGTKIVNGEEKAICSDKNIKEIANEIIKKNYCTDTIIINVSNCILDFNSQKLSILYDKNSEINVLDGQHRIKAIRLAEELSDDVDLKNLYFPIQIENLKVEKAQVAFSQFTKGLKISTTRSEFFNNANPINTFIKETISKSAYNGCVEVVKDSIKGTGKLVSFGTLVNAFKENFTEDNLSIELSNFLVTYLGKLKKEIERLVNSDSIVSENIMYYGYITLARRLYENQIYDYDLDKIFNQLEFEKSSSLWKGKILLQGKRGFIITNKKDTRKYVSNVFENIEI